MKNINKTFWVIFTILILAMNDFHCNGEVGDEMIAPMEKTEKESLYSAIQGFVGNWWNGSDLYPDPCGWTPIQGVSCDIKDGFWYVTNLNIGPIQDNSLKCASKPEFKPQIFQLRHLKLISFYNCFTSDISLSLLPTDNWLKLAASLESLEFRLNPGLIGPIPSIFSNLLNLQSLVLVENGFTGSLPLSLGNLRRLKRLVISGNNCSGRIPDSVGNLTELLILDLSRNSLHGYLPSSIGYLKSLLKLDLGNNMLEGTIPKEIGNLKNLTLLDLRNNSFTGGLTGILEDMDSLQELVLSSNPIGGDMKNVDWQKMQNIRSLDLSDMGLVGELPKSMTKLQQLRYVGLGNNKLSGNLPIELANMPCVTAFYVNGNNLTGELKLPEGFYGKLGRRFGAWNNPNLCYPVGLTLSGHILVGVEPCKSKGFYNDPVLKIELHNEYSSVQRNPNSTSSLGMSRCGINGFWWVFLEEIFIMLFLWNYKN